MGWPVDDPFMTFWWFVDDMWAIPIHSNFWPWSSGSPSNGGAEAATGAFGGRVSEGWGSSREVDLDIQSRRTLREMQFWLRVWMWRVIAAETSHIEGAGMVSVKSSRCFPFATDLRQWNMNASALLPPWQLMAHRYQDRVSLSVTFRTASKRKDATVL